MGTTLTQLKELLEKPGCTTYSDGKESLLYPFRHQGQMLHVHTFLLEEGDYVRFLIPCYLSLAESPRQAEMLAKMMELNFRYKLMKFGWDPRDGEVTVEVGIPVHDTELSEEQVRRCMTVLCSVAMDERDRLMALQNTGEYPTAPENEIDATLERLFAGYEGPGEDEENEDGEEEHEEDTLFEDEVDLPLSAEENGDGEEDDESENIPDLPQELSRLREETKDDAHHHRE